MDKIIITYIIYQLYPIFINLLFFCKNKYFLQTIYHIYYIYYILDIYVLIYCLFFIAFNITYVYESIIYNIISFHNIILNHHLKL